ncbi:MAG: type II toxin-antitoxin system RelE/ParE family toxin [Muribaculaceae bacterium]|nr:type II toxin-antitoxin system RelE/ParE family toxin [Muribaculaceae bacterium]
MIITFEEDYLKDLYTEGSSSDKKHRYQPEIIKRYKRCVDYLKSATRKEDLFRINSLNFEALHGDKEGRFSIRVNDKYRIEFTLSETIEEPILTICNIVELSNHYK